MGIGFDLTHPLGWQAALAALEWQRDMGVSEVVAEAPASAFDLPDEPPWKAGAAARAPARAATTPPSGPVAPPDPVDAARTAAAGAGTLEELRAALAAFPHCELRQGARNTVFADGVAGARTLILGEAPGREEDLEGRPFVGEAGRLLDRMFAAIGLSRKAPDRDAALYITNVCPWRPPGNRAPTPAEIALFRPFVERHIALADPAIIVVMGNTPLQALMNRGGILSARGTWVQVLDRPVLPMAHPAYLLRNPAAKREAWADLLSLQARLRTAP
ncbi:MAG TPA: uracil-DNA glycosylase [Paracoccaceae bacterium]|nr:uracil-DNA glycosylase [Paracoccaceae bacterium]HMO73333.1 uracil-DNA glycosylase [Paracoccaceae bacterium]